MAVFFLGGSNVEPGWPSSNKETENVRQCGHTFTQVSNNLDNFSIMH